MKDNFESGQNDHLAGEVAPDIDLSAVEKQIKLAEQQAGIIAKDKEEVVTETIAMVEGNRRLNKRTISSSKFNTAYIEAEAKLSQANQSELDSEARAIEREAARIVTLRGRLQLLADESPTIDLSGIQTELDQAETGLQDKRKKLVAKKEALEQGLQELEDSNTNIIAKQADIADNDVDFALDTVMATKPGKFDKSKIKEDVSGSLVKRAEAGQAVVSAWEKEQEKNLDDFEALLTDIESRLDAKNKEREDQVEEFMAELQNPESDFIKSIYEIRKQIRKKSSGLFAGREKNQREIERLEREEKSEKEARARDFWQLNYSFTEEFDKYFRRGYLDMSNVSLAGYHFEADLEQGIRNIVWHKPDKLSLDENGVNSKIDNFLQRHQLLRAKSQELQDWYKKIDERFRKSHDIYVKEVGKI